MLTSVAVRDRREAPCHPHALRDAAGVHELDAPLVDEWTLDRLPADRDRTAPGAHREAPLAVRVGHRPDVAVMGQDLGPALDLGREREDPLERRPHQEPELAPHGASTSSSARGESASVAGRQSPSAEPSRSADARSSLEPLDGAGHQRRGGQHALDQPAERRLRRERAPTLSRVGRRNVAGAQDRVGRGPRRAQRAVDALAGERIDEPRRVADEEPSGTGRARDAVADRGGAADRRDASDCPRAAWRRPGARRWRPRSAPPSCRQRSPSSGSAMPTFSSPPGVGASPTYQSGPTCISPWSASSAMPCVVGNEAEPAGEAHRSVDADEPADRRARAVGPHGPVGATPRSRRRSRRRGRAPPARGRPRRRAMRRASAPSARRHARPAWRASIASNVRRSTPQAERGPRPSA